MHDTVQIFIADDHPLFRAGLRLAIEKEPGFVVVGEASNGAEALQRLHALSPSIVVLDLEMPVMNGLDAAKHIAHEWPAISIIILTMYDDEEMFDEAMDIGVQGYILKDSVSMDIVQGIRAVADGVYYISPAMSDAAKRLHRSRALSEESLHRLRTLSAAEHRVLKLVGENRTSAEIAEILFISARTIDNHRTNICHKLGLSGNNALLRYALQHRGHFE